MAEEMAGTQDVVAIYIPEGTDEAYQPGNMRGRVMGAVRLLIMPADKSIRDFFYTDLDGSLRWPIGWPCRVVYAPPVNDCPYLRGLVDMIFGPNSFQPYVGQFLRGPFRLERRMADALMSYFEGSPRLD
jgi:hypothetical protein